MAAFFFNAVLLISRRLLVAVIFFSPCVAIAAPSFVVPSKEIIPIIGQEEPSWKKNWDEARLLVRQGMLEEAAFLYRKVLQEKPLAEVVTWEYCQLLFVLGRNNVLSPLLRQLIETDPYNNNYLSMAGFVDLSRGEYERAVQWLGEAYAAAPEGSSGVAVLAGLVDALCRLGHAQYAFPLMEQLYQRDPERPGLVENLAETAKKIGLLEKARGYYSMLIEQEEADERTLADAAEVLLAVNDNDGAAALWQRFLLKQPDNFEFRKMLAEYLQQRGRKKEALPHLLYLIENQPGFPRELLLVAGRIVFHDVGRADKALSLFEQYLQYMPEHQDVRAEIDAVQQQISKELLPIAENGKPQELWQDLGKITVDPRSIFLNMAGILEKRNKLVATVSLLNVLLENTDEEQDALLLRLVALNERLGKKQRAYELLCKVDNPVNRNNAWYRKKIQFERELGFDLVAYQTMRQLLKQSPRSRDVFMDVLRMAGNLGFLKDLEELGAQMEITGPKSYQDILDYCAALRKVGALQQAEELYDRLLQQSWLSKKQHHRTILDRAALYGEVDLTSKEQQQYRMLLAESPDDLEAIQALFAWAIETGDLDAAQILFDVFRKVTRSGDRNKDWSLETIIAQVRLLEAKGDVGDAVALLKKKRIVTPSGRMTQAGIEKNVTVELCRILLASGKSREAEKLLPESYRLSKDVVHFLCEQGSLERLFSLAGFAIQCGFLNEAEEILAAIIAKEPDSVRARLELARLYKRTKKWQQSSVLFRVLAQQFPKEPYYRYTSLELAMRLGEYAKVITETESLKEKDYSKKLQFLRARALWATKQFEKSLLLYEEILSPSVNEVLQQQLAKRNIDFESLGTSGWPFWKRFYFDSSNRVDTLNSITEDGGFLALVGREAGQIVASLYAAYRYEKLVKDEYLARKAIAENRYIAAKKQYQKSLRDQVNSEWLKDLAKIYQRLGDYDKEAVLYSVLTEQGETSPEVEESITQNKKLRSPYLGLEYAFWGRSGRDGAVDINRWAGGVGFGLSLAPSHTIKLQYDELGYWDEADERSLDGRFFQFSGKWDFSQNTSLQYTLGYHILDDEVESNLLCQLRLERDFSGRLVGYLNYDRDVVADTIESLERGITVQEVALGVEIEANNGFSMGGELAEMWYSDGNNRARIALWSRYSFFTEFASFIFSYDFELLGNHDSDEESFHRNSDTNIYRLSYWSPGEYSRHRLSVEYKHLLKNFHLFEEDVSYYTLTLGAGFETDESAFFTAELDIFLEISDHFLLKGDLLYSGGNDYDESRFAASLVYRW